MPQILPMTCEAALLSPANRSRTGTCSRFFRSEKKAMEQTGSEDQEIIHEFLVESHENLARLDQDLVKLEKRPQDSALLSSVFRTIHTIKGACGFLAFSTLERITHEAESLLSQLRDGQ